MSVIQTVQSAGGNLSATVFSGAWVTGTLYKKNYQVGHNGDLFLCTVTHTSGATTEPGVGASWTDNWVNQVDMLTADQIAACAGTGTPSGSNKFVTADHAALTDTRTPKPHNLVDGTGHTVTSLTTGNILTATGATTYGFGDIGTVINEATAKNTPVDADMLPLMDSEATPTVNVVKKLSWSYVKSVLKTYFDNIYEATANKSTDGTLADNSTTKFPSQSAVKTYVDSTSLYITATAGEALVKYNLVYAKSDGKYYKADAALTIIEADAVGIVMDTTISQNATGLIQTRPGYITNGSWNWTPHSQLYLGSSGAIVDSTTGMSFAKPIGYAETATQILFYPTVGWSLTESVSGLSPDQLTITFVPANYTRTVVPSCVTTAQLAAHLDGIDLALKAITDRLDAHSI